MSCLNLSLPPAPQIPPIFLPAIGPFTISFGTLGVTCCTITLPTFTLPIAFPGGSVFAVVIKAINAAILAAWPTLTLIIPSCPFNGTAPFGNNVTA